MGDRRGGWTVCAAAGLSCAVCGATPVSFGPGSGGSVALANSLGPGTFQTSITVADGRTVSGVNVLISSLVHNWMGELSATVTHVPTGRSASLFSRVGSGPSLASGDSSDFTGSYWFADGGLDLIAVAGSTGATSPIASGTYAASGVSGAAVSLAGVFGGIAGAGEWRLVLQNFGQNDTATFGSWTLGLDLVEGSTAAPLGNAALLGAAGLGWVSARRRRAL
ncbi:MAG: hypothetical protein AB7G17_03685 [Phycisphaerales bacterium]